MLTRKECLDTAESLADGNDLDRRNAARSLADYGRVILNEIGCYHSGYVFLKELSITHRYRLLRTAVPELLNFKKLFEGIDNLRHRVDHHDDVIPTTKELHILINEIKNFDQVFDKKIYPNLKSLDTSPTERLTEDWNTVVYLYDNLDNYLSSDMKGFEDVVSQVEDYFPIVDKFGELNDKSIADSRLKLRDLQLKLKDLLEQGKEGRRKKVFTFEEGSKTISRK